jgi:two-component system LytT family response regulator
MAERKTNSWRAVIVDDERLARTRLRALLAAHPEIEIVGEADGAAAALKVITAAAPARNKPATPRRAAALAQP